MSESPQSPEQAKPRFYRGSVVTMPVLGSELPTRAVVTRLFDPDTDTSETCVVISDNPPSLALPGTARNQDLTPTNEQPWTDEQIQLGTQNFLNPPANH